MSKSHCTSDTIPVKPIQIVPPTCADIGIDPGNEPNTIISQITRNQTQPWCRESQTCHEHECFDSNQPPNQHASVVTAFPQDPVEIMTSSLLGLYSPVKVASVVKGS